MKAPGRYRGKDYQTMPCEERALGPRLKMVLDVFSRNKSQRILDVGCGDGNFTLLLKKACGAREAYGVEISAQGVQKAAELGIKCSQINVDGNDLLFEEGFFDAVFSGALIEHSYDPDHFLGEVHRVLKPQGLLVLTTMNLASWFNRIALLLGYQPYGTNPSLKFVIGYMRDLQNSGMLVTADHIRPFTIRALKKLLQLHHFTITKVMGVHEPIPRQIPLSALLNAVHKMLSIFPSLCYMFCICRIRKGK